MDIKKKQTEQVIPVVESMFDEQVTDEMFDTETPASNTPEEAADVDIGVNKWRSDQLNKLSSVIPTDKIEEWKKDYGTVSLSVLGEDENELYIVRPIQTIEFLQLKRDLQAKLARDSKIDSEREYYTMVVNKACLWSNVEKGTPAFKKAGTVDTLGKIIERISNFIPIQEAMLRTFKL